MDSTLPNTKDAQRVAELTKQLTRAERTQRRYRHSLTSKGIMVYCNDCGTQVAQGHKLVHKPTCPFAILNTL